MNTFNDPSQITQRVYRRELDGLKALAVLAVIIFHFKWTPNGYLGVDVFFVISGYLITGIIYTDLVQEKFSIYKFYFRRIRRILPLTLTICFVSMVIGLIVMLPDDLENLCQSIIATNFFSNNILQAITTKNYWDVVNEFKPLIHTWSLAIEEQYYIIYPIALLWVYKRNIKFLLPFLFTVSIVSLFLFLSPFQEHHKFYYLPFRLFELSAGGLTLLYSKKGVVIKKMTLIYVITLIYVLYIHQIHIPQEVAIPMVILLSCGILLSDHSQSKFCELVLQNKISTALGLMSFSLYMWHQVVLVYTRYFILKELKLINFLYIFIITLILSIFSYHFIEKPFRNNHKIGNKYLLIFILSLYALTTIPSVYIYSKGGVLKDFPELDITLQDAKQGIHANYNSRIYQFDKQFIKNESDYNVLVVGNSFARDWANVLLESKFSKNINLSYIHNPFNHPDLNKRMSSASLIFINYKGAESVLKIVPKDKKVIIIGIKNFGVNNGIFYNFNGENYYDQRTPISEYYLEKNNYLQKKWGDDYLNLINKLIDQQKTVPVFTPSNLFISQDCRHFTRAGAVYFAQLFDKEIKEHLSNKTH